MYGEFSFGEQGIAETQVLSAVEKDFNCFLHGGEVDLSVCRKVGFKNVQARKAWHGIFGFNTEWAGICYSLSLPGGDIFPCPPGHECNVGCDCLWEPYQGTPPTNKYLDFRVIAHSATELIDPPGPSTNATLIRKVSLNRYSGCQKITECSDSYSDIGTFEALQNALTGSTTIDPCSLGGLDFVPRNGAFNIAIMMQWARPISNLFVCGATTTAIRVGCEPQYTCTATDIPSGNVIATLDVDGIDGTMDFFQYTIDGLKTCEIHIVVDETVSFFEVKAFGYTGLTLASTAQFSTRCELSNPYSSEMLYEDLKTLLNRIDMSDDEQYPWRTDSYISIAPLMTFDENGPVQPDPSCAIQTPCATISTCMGTRNLDGTYSFCNATGTMLGDLLPAGYGPFFDWNHRTWRCCQGDSSQLASYIYAYGAWAHTPPDSPIPTFTFTTCPPNISPPCPPPPAPPATTPIIHYSSSGGTIMFQTNEVIPAWTGAEFVCICGTNAIDGIYLIAGPTGTGPYEYTVIPPQQNQATFQPGCEGGVVGVCQPNRDATYYTAGDTTDLAMPPTATQWSENRSETLPLNPGDMPSGGWLIFTSDYLFGQKWAEIKIHRPSYNFARPCGTDKWMLDETKVTCVESSDGLTPPTLEIYADVGLADDDLVYVAGVTETPGIDDGVFKITRVDDTHIKLRVDCTMRRIEKATQTDVNTVSIVMIDPMLTINSGDTVDIVGIPGLGAGLEVNVTDSIHFTVPGILDGGTEFLGGFAFVSGSHAYQIAPDTIDFNPGDGSNGIVGKIRLEGVTGICGRLSVVSATQQGSDVLIKTGTHYLQQGDHIEFDGVGGLSGSYAVTVIDSTSFTIVGVVGTYTGGGTVNVTGTEYQWNDDASKGNFLYAVFEYNNRDYQQADRMCQQFHGGSYSVCGVDQFGCNECAAATPGFTCIEVAPDNWESDVRQFQLVENGLDRSITNFDIEEDCLPFDPCNPQVLAIVPHGSPEDFDQPSKVGFFPTEFVSDWRYGSRWQAFYVQQYTDLLAQTPHKPCFACDPDCECTKTYNPIGCPFHQDDGSCQQDTCQQICTAHTGDAYYAHLPQVEALQDVPDGAPTPPFGQIGFPTYEQLSTLIVDPTWARLFPPQGPGYGPNPGLGGVDPCLPAIPETPWSLAINEWLCICSMGRFTEEYKENGQDIHCPTPPTP